MRREWEPEDLVACWTLVEHDERELVAYKRGATRLGFALMLKFFEIDARFPRHVGEYPPAAVDYVARQVGVDPGELVDYQWSGRTFEYHRAQIRRAMGFRRFSEDDEAKLAGWLAAEIAPVELSDERLREALLAHCRSERIEPPARVDRILGAARAAVSDRFTAAIINRLTPATVAGLDALAGLGVDGQDPASRAWLAELKADPGRVSRDSLRSEIAKLARVRALGLPDGLFDGWSDTLVAAWRARAAVEYPSDLRAHNPAVRLTLLATLAWIRQGEIIDGLVDLLIALVHKIDSRAVQGAQAELIADLHRVRGKENLLFRIAEAALDHPDDTVRAALYPVVAPATLAELVREGRASASALRADQAATARLVLLLLPAGDPGALGGVGVPVLEHPPRAGDRRVGADAPLRRPLQCPVLRRPGERAAGRDRAGRLAERGPRRACGRRHAGGADPLRAVRAGRAARGDPPTRSVGRGHGALAQPRHRPADRFRRAPGQPLQAARAAAGPDRVHHRAAQRIVHRAR